MKKVMVAVIWLVLIFAMVGTAAADNPPWPATVFNHLELGECYVVWLASGLETFVIVPGQGVSVYQEKTGNWSGFCNAFVDFNDPNVASLSEACANTDWSEFCNGKGGFIMRGSECTLSALGFTTDDSIYQINPSGHIELTCHFNGAAP